MESKYQNKIKTLLGLIRRGDKTFQSTMAEKTIFFQDLGRVLCSLLPEQEGFEIWSRYLEQTSFDRSEFQFDPEQFWEQLWTGDINQLKCIHALRRLQWWAMEDSPEEYQRYVKEQVNRRLQKQKFQTPLDLAKLFILLRGRDYLVDVSSTYIGTFYKFEHSSRRWVEVDRQVVQKTIKKTLRQLLERFRFSLVSSCFPPLTSENRNLCRLIGMTIMKLRHQPFQHNITYEVRGMLKCSILWDQDRNLLGMSNGIFDGRTNTFRPGRREDLILLSTGTEFKPLSDWKEEEIEEAKKAFTQPLIESLRRGLLGSMNASLGSKLPIEIFRGSPWSTDSLKHQLLRAFGNYIQVRPSYEVLGIRNWSNQAPSRIVIYDEPYSFESQTTKELSYERLHRLSELIDHVYLLTSGELEISPRRDKTSMTLDQYSEKYPERIKVVDLPEALADSTGTWSPSLLIALILS
jgi:hypothetical protein